MRLGVVLNSKDTFYTSFVKSGAAFSPPSFSTLGGFVVTRYKIQNH